MRSSFEARPLLANDDFVANPAPSFAADVREQPAEDARAAETAAALEALRQAREQGRADAEAALAASERERLEPALAALAHSAAALDALRAANDAELRQGIVELGLAIARRMVSLELAQSPEALLPLVEQALALLAGDAPTRLALSPSDLERVRAGGAERIEELAAEWSLELLADAELAAGEARVIGESSRVEVRLDELLARFREGLADALPGGSA